MTTDPKIEALRQHKDEAKRGGGVARVDAQHKNGRLTARERLDLLLDKGSFRELDAFVTHRTHDLGLHRQQYLGDSVINRLGTISRQAVYVVSQEFNRFCRLLV